MSTITARTTAVHVTADTGTTITARSGSGKTTLVRALLACTTGAATMPAGSRADVRIGDLSIGARINESSRRYSADGIKSGSWSTILAAHPWLAHADVIRAIVDPAAVWEMAGSTKGRQLSDVLAAVIPGGDVAAVARAAMTDAGHATRATDPQTLDAAMRHARDLGRAVDVDTGRVAAMRAAHDALAAARPAAPDLDRARSIVDWADHVAAADAWTRYRDGVARADAATADAEVQADRAHELVLSAWRERVAAWEAAPSERPAVPDIEAIVAEGKKAKSDREQATATMRDLLREVRPSEPPEIASLEAQLARSEGMATGKCPTCGMPQSSAVAENAHWNADALRARLRDARKKHEADVAAFDADHTARVEAQTRAIEAADAAVMACTQRYRDAMAAKARSDAWQPRGERPVEPRRPPLVPIPRPTPPAVPEPASAPTGGPWSDVHVARARVDLDGAVYAASVAGWQAKLAASSAALTDAQNRLDADTQEHSRCSAWVRALRAAPATIASRRCRKIERATGGIVTMAVTDDVVAFFVQSAGGAMVPWLMASTGERVRAGAVLRAVIREAAAQNLDPKMRGLPLIIDDRQSWSGDLPAICAVGAIGLRTADTDWTVEPLS